jgi:hypothetical protein
MRPRPDRGIRRHEWMQHRQACRARGRAPFFFNGPTMDILLLADAHRPLRAPMLHVRELGRIGGPSELQSLIEDGIDAGL